MIDRILVVCQTKQESLKWVEVLRNQIKSCRVTSSTSQLPQPPQQLPFHTSGSGTPVHVSSPPYIQLTSWIRSALESGSLSIDILRQILKSDYFPHAPAYRTQYIKRQRLHKVECVIFPSREISGQKIEKQTSLSSSLERRELVFDYESENPYGFIRYFDPSRETEDEITFLLPSTARSSDSFSQGSSNSSSPTTSYISSYGSLNVTKTILQIYRQSSVKNNLMKTSKQTPFFTFSCKSHPLIKEQLLNKAKRHINRHFTFVYLLG